MTPPAARTGMVGRVLESWWAPRRVVRGLAGMPDRVLIAVLMLAMLIFLIAQAPGNARDAQLDPTIPLDARMAGSLLAVMFIMPLIAYAVAGLVALLTRLTGRRLAPQDSRLALFWALLAAGPAMLLSGMVAGFIGPGPALAATRLIAGLGFLYIWGAGISVLTRRAA